MKANRAKALGYTLLGRLFPMRSRRCPAVFAALLLVVALASCKATDAPPDAAASTIMAATPTTAPQRAAQAVSPGAQALPPTSFSGAPGLSPKLIWPGEHSSVTILCAQAVLVIPATSTPAPTPTRRPGAIPDCNPGRGPSITIRNLTQTTLRLDYPRLSLTEFTLTVLAGPDTISIETSGIDCTQPAPGVPRWDCYVTDYYDVSLIIHP